MLRLEAGSFEGTEIGTALAVMPFGCAPEIAVAIERAVAAGDLGYVSRAHVETLARSTSSWLEREYQWKVHEQGIRPVGDLVSGFRALLTHFLADGAPIIVPTPAYMPFLSLPPSIGHPVIEVPLRVDEGRWRYDLDGIRAAFASGGKMLVLCNPHNPIGKVADSEELREIQEVVASAGGLVFADEIHAPLRFGGRRHIPYASQSPVAASHTITATSASKAFNIPGVKCGQLVFTNPDHLERWMSVARWYEYHASSIGVAATVAAYDHGAPWLDRVRDDLDVAIREAVGVLRGAASSVRAIAPEGTYLLWIDLSRTVLAAAGEERGLASELRTRTGLIVTDGSECGAVGRGYVRFNAALPRELLAEAMNRFVSLAGA